MTLSQQLSDVGKKAYVKLGDNLGSIVLYGGTGFLGGHLGNLEGVHKRNLLMSKVWNLRGKLWIESDYTMPTSEIKKIAINTIDPLYNLYPKIGLIAGAIILPLSIKLLLTYGPGLCSKLRDTYIYGLDGVSKLIDTYHTWKGELHEEQTIDV